MTKDLIPLTSTTAITPAAEMIETAREYARAALSPSSRRNYEAQWTIWSAHCSAHGLTTMPAEPNAVAVWIADRAKSGQSISTLRVAVAAIRHRHHDAGLPFDGSHPGISKVLKGIARTHARVPKQAEPLRALDVTDILRTLTRSAIDLRDGALFGMMLIGALRRSEATGLDYQTQGTGDGFLTIGASEIAITFAKTKTGNAASGNVEQVLARRSDVATAVAAIEAWITAAKVQPGEPILRPVSKNGQIGAARLSGNAVSEIIKSRVAEHLWRKGSPHDVAKAEAAKYSGHSLRVGFSVSAAEAGASADEIATVTRHKTLDMPRRYAKRADAIRRSPHRRAGVGTDVAGDASGK